MIVVAFVHSGAMPTMPAVFLNVNAAPDCGVILGVAVAVGVLV